MCRLKPEAYAPQEIVIREGEPTEKFYLLQKGVMASRGRIISSGNFIGGDFVLHKSRRNYSVRAITFIDVFSLSKSNLEEVLGANRLPTIAPRVRLFAIQTAFTKGLGLYSKGKFVTYKRTNGRRNTLKKIVRDQIMNSTTPPPPHHYSQQPEEHDVMHDAEREIALSQSVQSPSSSSSSSSSSNNNNNNNNNNSSQFRNHPGSTGNTNKKNKSPYGKGGAVRKISSSAVGSASKVLQLMAERHDHTVLASQKCMDTINQSNRETLKKLTGLEQTVRDQQNTISKGIKYMFMFCIMIFVVSVILLLKSLRAF